MKSYVISELKIKRRKLSQLLVDNQPDPLLGKRAGSTF